MNKHSDIDKKVNKTLESLEGIQKAEPIPFFFTRLKARLEREEKNIWETMGAILARPIVAFACLFLIIGVNAFVLFEKDTPASYTETAQEDENMLTAANSFDYENLEP
jgi:hypothetical protein